MFCMKCGKQLPDGSKFCEYCGQKMAPADPKPEKKKRGIFRKKDQTADDGEDRKSQKKADQKTDKKADKKSKKKGKCLQSIAFHHNSFPAFEAASDLPSREETDRCRRRRLRPHNPTEGKADFFEFAQFGEKISLFEL